MRKHKEKENFLALRLLYMLAPGPLSRWHKPLLFLVLLLRR